MSGNWRNAMHLQMLANLAEVCREQLRPRATGRMVARLEESFAKYVGAKHAIAMTNGTVTLQVGLAMGWPEATAINVTPLTMSATTAAIVAAGMEPYWADVDPRTWVIAEASFPTHPRPTLSVDLFGLSGAFDMMAHFVDAAQSIAPHTTGFMRSYSFQSSKHISSGEGGMLDTNDD
jgi:perosamine synthetase